MVKISQWFGKNKNVEEESFKVEELPQKSFNGTPTDEIAIKESVIQAQEIVNTFKPTTEPIKPTILNIVQPGDDTGYNEAETEADVIVTNSTYVEEEALYNNGNDEDLLAKQPFDVSDREEEEVLELLARIEKDDIDEEEEQLLQQIENELKQSKGRTSVSIVYDENDTIKRRTFHFNEDRVDFEAKYYLEIDTYGYFTGKDERGVTIQINPTKCYTVEIKG